MEGANDNEIKSTNKLDSIEKEKMNLKEIMKLIVSTLSKELFIGLVSFYVAFLLIIAFMIAFNLEGNFDPMIKYVWLSVFIFFRYICI